MKNDRESEKPERYMWKPRDPNDEPLTPGSHEQLWQIAVRLPTDFEPYGQRKRDVGGDCSCSCRWFLPLVAMPLDWGVCGNAASPRVGLLTFEHQGCPQYEMEEEEEMDEEEATTEESTPPEPSPAKTLTVRDCRVLVVDEPLSALIPFLEDQQFRARPLTPGMDEQIAKPNTNGTIFDLCGQLGERFLVTDRTEVFRHAAAVCGFSIIDTAQYTRDPQSVAEEIAERWILLHVRGSVPYILRLRNHDQPVIERVE